MRALHKVRHDESILHKVSEDTGIPESELTATGVQGVATLGFDVFYYLSISHEGERIARGLLDHSGNAHVTYEEEE